MILHYDAEDLVPYQNGGRLPTGTIAARRLSGDELAYGPEHHTDRGVHLVACPCRWIDRKRAERR